MPSETRSLKPPSMWDEMSERLGLQRLRRSGRGCPMRSFSPFVNRAVTAQPSARPIHPTFHSHSFLFKVGELNESFWPDGPGTNTRLTIAMMIAGAMRDTTNNTGVDTFCFSTYGKLILGSTREKGLWFGSTWESAAAMAAMMLVLH